MKDRSKILVFCLLIFLLIGCKKNGEDYYIPASFKQWVLFNKGSYWVYLNETSNKFDSCPINNAPIGYLFSPDGGGKHYETILYNVDYIGSFYLKAAMTDAYLWVEGNIGGAYLISYLATINESDQVSATCRVVERKDSIIINNHIYYDVIYTRDSESSFKNSQANFTIEDFYLAKNIGLIKFTIKTESSDSTWSLARFNVNQ